MATSNKVKRGGKSVRRTRPRVEDTEDNKGSVVKDVSHKRLEGVVGFQPGFVEVQVQGSELVPVAQYASVTLGPIGFKFHASGVDMSVLGDVDWDNPDLTKEQEEAFDRAKNMARGGMAIISEIMNEDRALVEESVRRHNQRVKAEEEEKEGRKRR